MVGLIAGGAWLKLRDRAAPKLDCAPAEIHLDENGVARCGPGKPLTAAQGLTVGQKADLNTVSEADLAELPGIGQTLAAALVERRKQLGKFQNFEQVDEVAGVGPAKLEALKQMCEIR
ncbi:MAG: helix-hairpin-helix domain-containing protein [Myxococcaceae bacterium]